MKTFNEFKNDLNTTNSNKAIRHDWATHIKHPSLGAFKVESHSLDEDGKIEEYYVVHEGYEITLPAVEITVLEEMSHSHGKKSKKKWRVRQKNK